MALAALATSGDLTARGITSDADDTASLAAASEAVRDAAGNCITALTSTVTLPAPRGQLLTLPSPVTAVASVTVDGRALTQGTDYYVVDNGIWSYCGWDYYDRPVVVVVTFTHGLADVPVDIIDLTCALAAQWKAAKAAGFVTDPGVASFKVDDYAETRTPESAGQVIPVWIPKPTRSWLASRFGGGAYVVEMG